VRRRSVSSVRHERTHGLAPAITTIPPASDNPHADGHLPPIDKTTPLRQCSSRRLGARRRGEEWALPFLRFFSVNVPDPASTPRLITPIQRNAVAIKSRAIKKLNITAIRLTLSNKGRNSLFMDLWNGAVQTASSATSRILGYTTAGSTARPRHAHLPASPFGRESERDNGPPRLLAAQVQESGRRCDA
jgi:hypothetical protein